MKSQILFGILAFLVFTKPFDVIAGENFVIGLQALQELKTEAAQEGLMADTGALILSHKRELTADEKGNTVLRLYVCGIIFDDSTARDYSQVSISHNAFYEKTHLDFAHTIQENHEVIDVAEDAVQLKTVTDFRGPKKYSDFKSLTFSLPALGPGSVFEFQVTRTITPVVEPFWARSMCFSFYLENSGHLASPRVDPVHCSTVSVTMPRGAGFKYKAHHCDILPMIENKKNTIQYIWKMKNLAGLKFEKHMPNSHSLVTAIDCTSIPDWETVDRWAFERFIPNTVPDAAVTEMVNRVTKGLTDRDEKIKAIYDYLQKNIEYIAADLGRGGYGPHPAGEVLKNRYGDCKDQTVLFIAMLKAMGVNARPALLNSFPSVERISEIPSPYFNHVIVFIPGPEKDMWLDTVALNRYPDLLWTNQGRSTFIVDGKGGMFKKTPANENRLNEAQMAFRYSLKNGAIFLEMEIKAYGAVNDNFKAVFRRLAPEARSSQMREWIKQLFPSAKSHTANFSDLDDPDQPLCIKVACRFAQNISTEVSRIPFSTNFMIPISFFTSLAKLSPPSERTTDFVMGYGYTIRSEHTYDAEDAALSIYPLPVFESVDSEFVRYQTHLSEDQTSVKASIELVLKCNRIPLKKYDIFYNDIQKVINNAVQTFTLTKKKVDETAIALEATLETAPDDSATLLSLAKHYLKTGKYSEARDLLRQALTVSPESGEIHYFMGMALGYGNEMEQAQKEFETAMDMGFIP